MQSFFSYVEIFEVTEENIYKNLDGTEELGSCNESVNTIISSLKKQKKRKAQI